MAQADKFESFEKQKIKSLLDILFPNEIVELRAGIAPEPDGMVQINGKIIGIELRRFSEETLERESAITKIQNHLELALSNLNSNLLIQIDGNKIPVDKKGVLQFNIDAERELRQLIPSVTNDQYLNINGIPINILISGNTTIKVHFRLTHVSDSESYEQAVLSAIVDKNTKNYSETTKWLLLYENTNLPYYKCDFERLANQVKAYQNQFERIYILTSYRLAGIINPNAFQIFPEFKSLYNSISTL